jgi:hypothetical protein
MHQFIVVVLKDACYRNGKNAFRFPPSFSQYKQKNLVQRERGLKAILLFATATERFLSVAHHSSHRMKKTFSHNGKKVFFKQRMVGRHGFEPWKSELNRFTVCPLWPLGYLPTIFKTR